MVAVCIYLPIKPQLAPENKSKCKKKQTIKNVTEYLKKRIYLCQITSTNFHTITTFSSKAKTPTRAEYPQI